MGMVYWPVGPAPILFYSRWIEVENTSFWYLSCSWSRPDWLVLILLVCGLQPSVLPIQILRIGQFIILSVSGGNSYLVFDWTVLTVVFIFKSLTASVFTFHSSSGLHKVDVVKLLGCILVWLAPALGKVSYSRVKALNICFFFLHVSRDDNNGWSTTARGSQGHFGGERKWSIWIQHPCCHCRPDRRLLSIH